MAVFSDTLHMSPLSSGNGAGSNDFEDDYKMHADAPPSNAGAARPFEVYTDPPPRPFEVFIDQPLSIVETDKENMKPIGFVPPPKREKSGILSPAKDIALEPQEKEDDFCGEQMDTHELFVRPEEPAKRMVDCFNYSD